METEKAQWDKDKVEVLVEIIPVQAEIVFAQIVEKKFLMRGEFLVLKSAAQNAALQ